MKTRVLTIRNKKPASSSRLVLWGSLIFSLGVGLSLAPNLAAAPGWTSVAAMHTATLLSDGRVLISGGRNSSASLASAEIYSPATNTWTSALDMQKSRSGHTATLLSDGRVLVAGGIESSLTLASVEIYNPATNTWTSVPDMQTTRSSHTASLLPDGRVLVAGGDSLVLNSSGEVYDPATKTWFVVPNLGGASTDVGKGSPIRLSGSLV